MNADLSQEQRDLMTALRRALAGARGEIRVCPDCSGRGQARWTEGYCLRCDGAGEIAASLSPHIELRNQDGDAYDVTTEPLAMDGDGDVGRRSSPSSPGDE